MKTHVAQLSLMVNRNFGPKPFTVTAMSTERFGSVEIGAAELDVSAAKAVVVWYLMRNRSRWYVCNANALQDSDEVIEEEKTSSDAPD